MGDKSYPKERMDVFSDGNVLSLDDYKCLDVAGTRLKRWSANSAQKGQFEELNSLADYLLEGKAWPISLNELISASRISFDVEAQLMKKVGV